MALEVIQLQNSTLGSGGKSLGQGKSSLVTPVLTALHSSSEISLDLGMQISLASATTIRELFEFFLEVVQEPRTQLSL